MSERRLDRIERAADAARLAHLRSVGAEQALPWGLLQPSERKKWEMDVTCDGTPCSLWHKHLKSDCREAGGAAA